VPNLKRYATEDPNSKRKRDKEEAQEDDDFLTPPKKPRNLAGAVNALKCNVCHDNPPQPPHAMCTKCRIDLAKYELTPPGKMYNRNNKLVNICIECKKKPSRKSPHTKCNECSYATNKNKCKNCGRSGTKLSKGFCGAGDCKKKREHANDSSDEKPKTNLKKNAQSKKRALESSDDEISVPAKKHRKEKDDSASSPKTPSLSE
jgi:hypothetical protein